MEERLGKAFPEKDEEPEDPAAELEEKEEAIEEEVEDSDGEIEEEDKVIVSKDSLDALKVAVAHIRNPQDKARASDALVKVYGRSKPTTNVYETVFKQAVKSSQAKDEKPSINFEDLGKQIAAKWNPHYKKGE